MSTSLVTRPLSFVLRILVPAAVVFLLLNFLYVPSCGRFACGYAPSWWPQAHADDGDCPDSVHESMQDSVWAADRYSSIADEHITTGLFFDEDGAP